MAAKGQHPNSRANLKKGKATQFKSGEQAAKAGSKGGKKSQEVQRRKRSMKQMAKMLMDMGVANEKVAAQMHEWGIADEDTTNQAAVMVAMINQATRGNVKAAYFLRDIMGEDPQAEFRKEEQKLRREQFEYQKQKDAGDNLELEDLEEVEADIYGDEESPRTAGA